MYLFRNGITKQAQIFLFFKAHLKVYMAMRLGTFCGALITMCYLWLIKGQLLIC